MTAKRALALLAAIAALGALALAWRPQPAAGMAAAATPVPGGPGFYSVSAYSFHPTNVLVEWEFSGTWLYNPDPTLEGAYAAALELPHGATVTKFVVYYFDDSVDHEVTAYLYQCPLDGTSSSSMAFVQSTGVGLGPRYVEDTTITSPVIDNRSYSYAVRLMLPPSSDGALIGVRVDYEFSAKLPAVMKNY